MITPPLPLDGAPPYPKGYLPGKIVPGSERRVYAVRNSRGKVAALYAARTASGRVCVISAGWPFGGGGCSGASGADAVLGPDHGKHRARSRPGRSWLRAHGRRPRVEPARRRRARRLRGRPPRRHRALGPLVHVRGALRARQARRRAGAPRRPRRRRHAARVGSRTRGPCTASRRTSASPFRRASSCSPSAELPNDGGTLRIWSGRDAQGHDCFRHLRDGRTQMFPAWTARRWSGITATPLHPLTQKQSQVHTAVQWQMGLRNDPAQDRRLRLRLRHRLGRAAGGAAHACASRTAPLRTSRCTTATTSTSCRPPTGRPGIARASSRPGTPQGALVYHAFLYPRQHCIYPGADPLCRNQAMGTG